jgi:hypothetical protein
MFKKNWRTTLSGLGSILVGVGSFMNAFFDVDMATEPDYTAISAAIVVGLGLIFARDGNDPPKS